MTRYFFYLHDDKVTTDKIGTELADLDAALEFARGTLIDMAKSLSRMRDADQVRINVRDAEGLRVLTGTLLLLIEPTE